MFYQQLPILLLWWVGFLPVVQSIRHQRQALDITCPKNCGRRYDDSYWLSTNFALHTNTLRESIDEPIHCSSTSALSSSEVAEDEKEAQRSSSPQPLSSSTLLSPSPPPPTPITPLETAREVSGVVGTTLKRTAQRLARANVGFFYGLTPSKLRNADTMTPSSQIGTPPRRLALQDTMRETLDELRSVHAELEILRKELQALKRQMLGLEPIDDETEQSQTMLAKRKRQREFEKLSMEVEKWAEELLFQQNGETDGWMEIQCNRILRGSLQKDGGCRTRAYLKWLKDSRGSFARADDIREYPCIKMYATINAPLDCVCAYLANENNSRDYNDLIDMHRDLEEITPHSKICWTQTPQVLFIKPRELVTFCCHRWLRNGTQVVVNQAVNEFRGTNPSAFALRGATYIGRDPEDPEKTHISMLAHASPGLDVPAWAMKTVVNSVAPIEPFKLFDRINAGVQRCRPELERNFQETDMVSIVPGQTSRPAGLAQLGFACYWPNGGGLSEHKLDHERVTEIDSMSPPSPPH